MALRPLSRTARRRLTLLAVIAPIVALAVALALWGLSGSISYFYTPSQAQDAHVGAGRAIQLGGLVAPGSVVKAADGTVRFRIVDHRSGAAVTYRGDLPDLFREGQGVVAIGAFDRAGRFVATQILAKHDERYMPRALTKALKARGEWRADGATPSYGAKP